MPRLKISIIFFLLSGFQTIAFCQKAISVMSYNIRYDEPMDGENRWDLRRDKVAGLMQYYGPDFIGTQEAQPHQMRYLLEKLGEYAVAGRVPADGDADVAYQSLLYNKNKFRLVSEHFFWLSPKEDKTIGWDADLIRFCTYSLFKAKKSGRFIWMINAHFDHMGAEARYQSAKKVWDLMPALKKAKRCPVIFLGDLNGLPEEASIQFLVQRMVNTRTKSLEPAYGPLDTWNNFMFHQPLDGCYDYIFIEKNSPFEVQKFITITDSYDTKYPSDHLPVMATLHY